MTERKNHPLTKLEQGREILKAACKTLPEKPGVYRMVSADHTVLYVGKAKSLKRRVSSYTQVHRLPVRLQRMVSETKSLEIITTHTEVEALLLEANLIKRFSPRYNILLKDSKFFSFIHLSDHPYPRLSKYRGTQVEGGRYFGPFASTESVNATLTTLYKIFKLRSCSDSFFDSRKRPCLQYHIKRCTAPCVAKVSVPEYATQVAQTEAFLEGRSAHLQEQLAAMMQQASSERAYEYAAQIRDQIRALTHIQAQQSINHPSLRDVDILAFAREGGLTCIQVAFYRNGSHYGSRSFYPQHAEEMQPGEILAGFMGQFYQESAPAPLILVSCALPEQSLVEEALSQAANKKISISHPLRGAKKRIMDHALQNAKDALTRKLAQSRSEQAHLEALQALLELPTEIRRIEVYDNSHQQGSHAIGAMITAGPQGFDKKGYRKFLIRTAGPGGIQPGDDYGMMREVLSRRFSGSLREKEDENPLPDLLLIDGGPGQLSAVRTVLNELNLNILVLAIAKGPQRNAGLETFYLEGKAPFNLGHNPSLLHYLQRLRDEVHRFAITYHRARKTKALGQSLLDEVPGIGPKRKKALLQHFGSARDVAAAGVADLQNVEGISAQVAQKIYDYFHS
ncbi:MAG: excinuclease ABC subunit UvrC [Holosporales bacterium]